MAAWASRNYAAVDDGARKWPRGFQIGMLAHTVVSERF
jgi:hypothetical protein